MTRDSRLNPSGQEEPATPDRSQTVARPSWYEYYSITRAEVCEALGEVRPGDGTPLDLSWPQIISAIRDMRDERDYWRPRALASEAQVAAAKYAAVARNPHSAAREDIADVVETAAIVLGAAVVAAVSLPGALWDAAMSLRADRRRRDCP